MDTAPSSSPHDPAAATAPRLPHDAPGVVRSARGAVARCVLVSIPVSPVAVLDEEGQPLRLPPNARGR